MIRFSLDPDTVRSLVMICVKMVPCRACGGCRNVPCNDDSVQGRERSFESVRAVMAEIKM